MMGNRTEDGKDNKYQSENFRRSRKAAHILRQVFHSRACRGVCGTRVCKYTYDVLCHMQDCTSSSCDFSGCCTTKKLVNHYERCQLRKDCCPTTSHQPERTRIPLAVRIPNISTANKDFCLICTLASSTTADVTLEKISPTAIFGQQSDSDFSELKPSTYSSHFIDDSSPVFSSQPQDWDAQQQSGVKRFRGQSMDSIAALGHEEDAECINMISMPPSALQSPLHSLLPIAIVRETTALRNYSVSWDAASPY